ncbi:LysE family translocator [Actinomyces viscosus]|uniref:Threonine efflux protein n=1 Tax=Actinomyces viscosus TaxID=1656 RepID=A0A3S4V142_ACTVI|nr:LysE family translocator [Actinomyces viscosus]TFH51862.1 LysE family translocator [Actinomyces viscosus]VEI14753.1 Threonine efflux protein [Actinomyces viscosus]
MSLSQALAGFAVLALMLTLVPGLDTAVVLRGALTRSRSYAFAVIVGIVTGLVLWGAAAGAGATAILAASRTAYRALSLAGAVYLAWMGLRMIVRSRRGEDLSASTRSTRPVPALDDDSVPTGGLWHGWSIGLLTNLLNPKAGVFYLATIPQFMADGVPPLVMGILLSFIHAACTAVWLGALALGAAWVGPRVAGARLTRWIDRVTGGLLIGFGVKLALDARH